MVIDAVSSLPSSSCAAVRVTVFAVLQLSSVKESEPVLRVTSELLLASATLTLALGSESSTTVKVPVFVPSATVSEVGDRVMPAVSSSVTVTVKVESVRLA